MVRRNEVIDQAAASSACTRKALTRVFEATNLEAKVPERAFLTKTSFTPVDLLLIRRFFGTNLSEREAWTRGEERTSWAEENSSVG